MLREAGDEEISADRSVAGDMIRRRSQVGVQHAMKTAKTLGCPGALTKEKPDAIVKLRRQGVSIAQLSRTFGASPPTIRK